MKAFLDTSVLVAAMREPDQRYAASRRLLLECNAKEAACAAHSLAEFYASLTGMPPPYRFTPEQAVAVLYTIRTSMHCVELTADEVFQTLHRAQALHLAGGMIYDALIMACARKVNAERVYTWNERHFRMVAPDLAERIMRP